MKEKNLIKEDIELLDEKYEFEPLTTPRMFKGVFVDNPRILRRFLIDILNLNLEYDKTDIRTLKCTLSDNVVVLLNDDVYIEITFNKFDLFSEEPIRPFGTELDKKLEFLNRNYFDLSKADKYYLFLSKEDLTILKISLHDDSDE